MAFARFSNATKAETPSYLNAEILRSKYENENQARADALRSDNIQGGLKLYDAMTGENTPISDAIGNAYGQAKGAFAPEPMVDPADSRTLAGQYPEMGGDSMGGGGDAFDFGQDLDYPQADVGDTFAAPEQPDGLLSNEELVPSIEDSFGSASSGEGLSDIGQDLANAVEVNAVDEVASVAGDELLTEGVGELGGEVAGELAAETALDAVPVANIAANIATGENPEMVALEAAAATNPYTYAALKAGQLFGIV